MFDFRFDEDMQSSADLLTDTELRQGFESLEKSIIDQDIYLKKIVHYPRNQIYAIGVDNWRKEVLDGFDTYLIHKDYLEYYKKIIRSRKVCRSQVQKEQKCIEID